MPKTKISEYSVTNSSNTDIEGINIDEGCAPSGINNAIRELMVHLKEFQTGASGDAFTFAGGVLISGTANTITGNVLMSGTNTITGSTTATFAAGAVGTPSIAAHGDTNTGIFFPAADTIAFAEGGAEAMRIDSSGNVGIGTSSPLARLDVKPAAENILTGGLRVSTHNNTTQYGVIANDGALQITSVETSVSAPSIRFNTSTNGSTVTERMRIDSSGNVGIGTSSPSQKLHLAGGSNRYMRVDVGTTAAGLVGGESNLFILGYNTVPSLNNVLDSSLGTGRLDFGNSSGGYIAFLTGATNTAPSERARITSGGYFKASNNGSYAGSTSSYHELVSNSSSDITVLAYASSASFTGGGIFYCQSNRNTTNNTYYAISYYNEAAAAFKFRVADSGNVTNTNGSYGTISDIKHKQDIVDAGSQWDDIKNLRFRKYRLKSEVELDPNAKHFLGLVAQEAELVSPGLIEEHRDTKQETKTREVEKTREIPAVLDEEGNEIEPARTETYAETEEYTETVDLGTTTKSIKTSILYMKAVKALQEAMTRIEALEAEVAAMKAKA